MCVFSYVEQYGWALASATHMCTVYATTLVAVHRYVYVCRPHDTERLSGLRRAKLHVAAVPLFAFFYNLPRVFEYKLTSSGSTTASTVSDNTSSSPVDYIRVKNASLWEENLADVENKLEFSAIGGSFPFQIIYKNVSFYLFMYIIPLTVLVAVTVRLIATLRMRQTNNAGNRNSFKLVTSSPTDAAATNLPTHLNRRQQTRDDNVTVVLIIVLVVFTVCQTPTLFQRLTLALTGTAGLKCGHPYYYVERISDYLVIFNSCVNFVIYVIFAPRFRRILTYEVLSPRYGRWCGRSRRAAKNALVAGEGFKTTVLAVGASKGRTGHEARCGNRTAGTGGDYCSEMAGCYGASSDQPVSLSKNSNHAVLQAPTSCAYVNGPGSGVSLGAGCTNLRNMAVRSGSGSDYSAKHASNGREIVSKSKENASWNNENELSSSVSSAGSSSLLPVVDITSIGGIASAP